MSKEIKFVGLMFNKVDTTTAMNQFPHLREQLKKDIYTTEISVTLDFGDNLATVEFYSEYGDCPGEYYKVSEEITYKSVTMGWGSISIDDHTGVLVFEGVN